MVSNNEIGFTKNNVEAICGVNRSTKQYDSSTIGQKGIGFKAVFLVTNSPIIISNGYRFKFNSELEVNGERLEGLG